MSIGYFLNKEQCPSQKEIEKTLGLTKSLWNEMVKFLIESYSNNEEFKFYGKNYGWALRFRKGSKSVASLYPNDKSFIGQIILVEKEIKATLRMNLSNTVSEVIKKATSYLEGRWLFITIKTVRDVKEFKQLIELKFPKRK